ncbi:selenium binding protein [Tannerella sp.]|uniref:selenium binding protein n=1 Tax=Tannerella sp. TaxID=2382127 RepID=UPI0026DD0E76|nr:selenium binding protein [Tannerella sp.]MDO4703448.1 selenium binding protein [Tannerella sp.]
MYEKYTKQALPSKEYRELLGSAICVFNSNNAFIIENILREDSSQKYNWWDLIDRMSGQLNSPIENTITAKAGPEISELFKNITAMRNRIVHSFQITDVDGEQRLATKYKDGRQEVICENYLHEFIRLNECLSSKLHEFRGY